MKKTLLAAAATVAVAAGCNQSPPGGNTKGTHTSSTPASAHTSNYPDTSVVTGTSRDSFVIKAPVLSTSIKQGDKQTVKLTVDRGSDFKQSVKLTAEAPKGVKAEFNKPTVAAGDTEDVALSITADKAAPLGDATIKVIGTPETGNPTFVDVKVKVDEVK